MQRQPVRPGPGQRDHHRFGGLPHCLDYRVTGMCYWLRCGLHGCSIRTSVKVKHYVPDAVVSSYANTGENPWLEVRALSLPNPTA